MESDQLIYLDHAATTPVAPEVFEAMRPYFAEVFGNPAAIHRTGAAAARAVDKAREQVASLLNASAEEIFFTSGGTESNNWFIKSVAGRGAQNHLVTSAIEHHAVLETVHHLVKQFGLEATILPVDCSGLVSPDDLRSALRPGAALVSVMHANNEIGTLEPIQELAAIAHEGGALFHADAVQSAGKVPIDVAELGLDALSLSAHKFHGPKGIGALFLRRGLALEPLLHGGGQERGRRAGTTNVPGAVGMGAAAALALKDLEASGRRERELVERLWQSLSAAIPRIQRNGHPHLRLPNLLHLSVAGVEGEAILLGLDRYGIQVSSGSACATGASSPSHVLSALGLPPEISRGSARFSLGRATTPEQIETVIEVMPGVVARLRDLSPPWRNSFTG